MRDEVGLPPPHGGQLHAPPDQPILARTEAAFVPKILAAIQAVPEDFYEAAALDGAQAISRFWTITLPNIRPMLLIVALYELLMAITAFDITYSLTRGGPGTATTMLTYFTWAESFKMLDFGRGSALAIVIALSSLVAILALLRAMPKDALLDDAR